MRPVRFVALSEDGQALVLADEVGRLLTLPIDDRVNTVLRTDRGTLPAGLGVGVEIASTLSPRDIQARIRAGETADDVARVAGVPVDRVLRYAGPVLQERAMLAQHARRTKLRGAERNATLAEVVDARLSQHGIDAEKISWDAYRRDDGTWRVVAVWPSGKATAQAIWELDKSRQLVTPHDDMAQYLCAERPTQILGQDPVIDRRSGGATRGEPSRGEFGRGGHEPMRPAADTARRESRPGRGLGPDPIRAGRDALLASLDRPLGAPRGGDQPAPAASAADATRTARGAAALIGRGPGGLDDDLDGTAEAPTVPSLAVLRPRRSAVAAETAGGDKPRKRLPSWDDVLFGGAPAARENR
jgi:Protein of unknown function (DUF3071)